MRTRATFRPRGSSSKKLVRRASTLSILSVAAALIVTNLTPVVVTSASWTGEEWDHGEVGTLSCADDGVFKTRGAGRLLSGGLLPSDLDTVATAGGVTVTNDGSRELPTPGTANSVGGAYVNALDVGVLSLIDLPLTGGGLDDLLSLPLDSEVGAVNQYALAHGTGVSQAAGGVVNDSGFIQTDSDDNGDLPALGSLKLSTLVEELTGEAVSEVVEGITDLQLDIGAVASRATLDACETAWTDDIDANLDRTYAIAGLDAEIDAPVVSGLSGTGSTLVDGLQTTLNGLAGDAGVLSAITSGVGGLLNGVLGGLKLGSTTITGPAITIDLAAVRGLLTATVSDDAGAVLLDVATGQVQVDLASLIGQAYGGQGFNGTQEHGLNGLPPNTELVLNGAVTNALVAALTEALDAWVQDILGALETAVYAAGVNVTVAIVLGGTIDLGLTSLTLDVASVNVTVNGSLGSLLNNTATVGVGLTLLGGQCTTGLELIPCLVKALVNPLISGITSALTAGVAPLIGDILETTILGEDGLVPNLGSTLATATAPVITALSNLLTGFLGVNGLISLRVNVQNDPAAGNATDPPVTQTYPDWEVGPLAVPDDQYDVAALSIGVLNALGTTSNVNLELARASVGVSCAVGGVWDSAERCSAY